MMVSTMSMNAGHSCTHAMHVVHAHSSSALISSPWIGPGSSPCMCRLSFTMICLGESAVPDRYAGQAAWQRPHSTQASKSSRRFHENSSSFEMPRVSASSMFSIFRIAGRGRIDAGRPADEPAPDCHAQADDEKEAEEVEHRLVEEIEPAPQELVPEERQRDVPVDRGEHGPHEQGEETPEHDRVHDPRVRLRERAHLAERVRNDEPDALGDPVEAVLSDALPPEAHPLPHSVCEDHDRQRAADVEPDLSPARDVPERIAKRNGRRHEGNLSTGRIGAEEGADTAPSRDSSDGDGRQRGCCGGAGGCCWGGGTRNGVWQVPHACRPNSFATASVAVWSLLRAASRSFSACTP